MNVIAVGLLILLFAFYLRIKPRLKQKLYGVDCWYYLLWVREFKRTRRLPVHLPYYLLDIEEQWYPPGFSLLLSLFPQRFLEAYQWAIAPAIDCVQLLLLGLFTYFMTRSILAAAVAAILYSVAPTLISENSNLNSRALGALILTLTMLSAFGYVITGSVLPLLAAIISGVALLCTHKMATQELVFLMLGLSIVTVDPRFVGILVAIFIGTVILTKGFYLKIIRGHIDILLFWRRNLPFLGAHQVYQSPIYNNPEKASAKKIAHGIRTPRWLYYLKALEYLIPLVILVSLVFSNQGSIGALLKLMTRWSFLTYGVVFLTTYVPPLRFLGEGYKYIKFGIFPTSLSVATFLFDLERPQTASFLLVAGIAILSLYIIRDIHQAISTNPGEQIGPELLEIIDFLRSAPRDNILCLPVSFSDAIAYFARKRVLWGAHSSGYDKLEPFFPVLKRPVEHFLQEYDISHVLLDQRYVDVRDIGFGKSTPVICREPLELFEING